MARERTISRFTFKHEESMRNFIAGFGHASDIMGPSPNTIYITNSIDDSKCEEIEGYYTVEVYQDEP